MAGSKISKIAAILLTAGSIGIGVGTTDAQQCHSINAVTCKRTTDASRQFRFDITEIIHKADDNLSRVCGNLSGTPHTSARIDSITLRSPEGMVKANDIDGVDFERYFQWEDDGTIYIEIDFPGYKKTNELLDCRNSEIVFHTVKGDVVIPAGTRKHK